MEAMNEMVKEFGMTPPTDREIDCSHYMSRSTLEAHGNDLLKDERITGATGFRTTLNGTMLASMLPAGGNTMTHYWDGELWQLIAQARAEQCCDAWEQEINFGMGEW